MGSDSSGLGWVLSHSDHSSCSQYQHLPQPRKDGTTTRSPTFSLVVSGPTSTTSPMYSWPITSPSRMVGMYPPSRCRSEPQVVVRRTLRIASCGLTRVGSATVLTWRSLTPIQHSALMSAPPD